MNVNGSLQLIGPLIGTTIYSAERGRKSPAGLVIIRLTSADSIRLFLPFFEALSLHYDAARNTSMSTQQLYSAHAVVPGANTIA